MQQPNEQPVKPTIHILLTSPTVLAPGDHVKGKLVVDVVYAPFELTNIYVELLGTEYSYMMVLNGLTGGYKEDKTFGWWDDGFNIRAQTNYHLGPATVRWHPRPFRFAHVDVRQVVHGAAMQNSETAGGVWLAPGHYEYPFDVQLPYGAPPTYTGFSERGGSRIHYKIRGVMNVTNTNYIEQKLRLIVLPVVSSEQLQFARDHTLLSPEQDVPVSHMLGVSKTQSVRLRLQLCPSVVVLGSTMADAYYAQQYHVAQGGGAEVVAQSLDHYGSSSDEDAGDYGIANEGPAFCALGAPIVNDGGWAQYTFDRRGVHAMTDGCGLQGKVLRLYANGEEKDVPFQPDKETPGLVRARVLIENHTKEKIKSFHVALLQERMIHVGSLQHRASVTLSEVLVQLPKGQPCKPGEQVAADVELPIRRDFVCRDKVGLRSRTDFQRALQKPCPNLCTPAFACENRIDVSFRELSLQGEGAQFRRCVVLADAVGVPGAPYITLPPNSQQTLGNS